MTFNGWLQIALYCVLLVLIIKPFGGYMTRVFNGERTPLSPVLGPLERGLYRVSGVDEAVRVANDTEYGLVAYLYTKDVGRGMRVSEKLEFGMIGLNRGLVSDPAAPFGGMKQSGIGREGAHEGLMEFLETQYVSVNW